MSGLISALSLITLGLTYSLLLLITLTWGLASSSILITLIFGLISSSLLISPTCGRITSSLLTALKWGLASHMRTYFFRASQIVFQKSFFKFLQDIFDGITPPSSSNVCWCIKCLKMLFGTLNGYTLRNWVYLSLV